MDRSISVSLAATLPLLYALFSRPFLLGIPLGLFAATRILPLLDIDFDSVDWEEARRQARLGAILACTFYSISPFCTPLCLLSLKINFLDDCAPYLLLFSCKSPVDLLLFLVWARCDAYEGSPARETSLLYSTAQDCILTFTLGTHGLGIYTRLFLFSTTLGVCAVAWKDKLPTIRGVAEGVYKCL